MYSETVFQQIAQLIDGQTVYLGRMVFFLLIIALVVLFKSGGSPGLLRQILEKHNEQIRQNSEIIAALHQLQVTAAATYEVQRATWQTLQIRSNAAAEKRGEKPPAVTTKP
jgi:hypothetical protein